MSVERLLGAVGPLLGSTEALAAVGAGLRLRRDGSPVDPELGRRLEAVLDGLAIRDAVDAVDPVQAGALLGLVESTLTQALGVVGEPRAGWQDDDPAVLLAQGRTSVLLVGIFRSFVLPRLGRDVEARLAGPGASFLDVGVGVGALSIAMCREWPQLGVVGIDPWDAAVDLAAEQVAAAGLGDRIELRRIGVDDLDDTDRHDLAWVPTMFIGAAGIDGALARVHASLRRGGWAILGSYARRADPLGAALADLRTVRHGGALVTPETLGRLMGEAGFVDVEVVFDPARPGPLVFVVGRR